MTQISVERDAAVHPLVNRITRMRGRVRAVLGLFGTGVLVSSAVGGIMILMLADYLLHFPAGVRVVLLLAWLATLAMVAWRTLVSPLSTRLTDQFLASRVENMHKDLADELISAVHFIHVGAIRTNALAARHVDSAAARTAGIRFEEAVDFRRSFKAIGIAALVVLASGALLAMNGPWTRIAFSRWFSANPSVWPHSTIVEFSWGTADGKPPAVIPIGEQFLVRAKVVAGGYASQRVWLGSWTDTRSAADELMTYQPAMSSGHEFVYEKTIEPEGERSLSLKLQAGDDTEQNPVVVRLAARPVVSELVASIQPPPYVKDIRDASKPAPAVLVDLLSQAGRAVEGATVTLNIRATKPFMLDSRGQPIVRLLDQSKDVELAQGMTRTLAKPDLAQVSFVAGRTLQARLSIRDADGFDNRAGGTLSLEVVPDALPSVVITEPRRMVERTPAGAVEVALQATDDLGLDGLKLVADKFDAKPGEPPVFETPLSWAERTADAAVGSTTGRANYTWDLTPLNLAPGTRLSFYAMVQDNYEVNGKRHPWVKSAPLTLQILSQADIERINRTALDQVKKQIETLKIEQEKTQARTDVIQKAAAESGVTTAQQKQQLAELAQQQKQEIATANGIRQRVDQIKEDLQQNKMSEGDLGKIASSVSEGMKDVGENNMPKASSELNKAQESAGNQDPKDAGKQDPKSQADARKTAESAKNASKQQGEAIAKMNNMIGQLGAAGDLQAALSTAKEIKKDQDKLAEDTQKHASENAGKEMQDLSKPAKDQLDKMAKDQADLAKRTQDLIDQMKKSADQQKQSDPAASQSMAKAAQAGEQTGTPGAQGQASQSLSKNQTNQANQSQAQAQNGLQQMIDQLSQAEKRELEQLQKQLAELIEEVKKLKASEEALSKDTVDAGAKAPQAAMVKLGDRQGTLQMNTIVIQKRAENTRDAQKAALDIRDAGEQMGLAATPLYANKQPAALDPETKAIAALAAAIDKLQKQKDKVDNQLREKDLAEFVKQYEIIKTAQEGVKKVSDQIEANRLASPDKELSRNDEVTLAGQVKPQDDLIDQVNKLSTDEKLKIYDVIIWMNAQITQAMTASKDGLNKKQTGAQLALAQQTAIDRLNDVIQALKEEQAKPDEFDNGGGGDGGGGGGKKPLLPPVAQMKMIRAMQNVVNAQTVGINKALQAAGDDTQKARLQSQAEKLGKTQGEIKEITQKVVRQASGGQAPPGP